MVRIAWVNQEGSGSTGSLGGARRRCFAGPSSAGAKKIMEVQQSKVNQSFKEWYRRIYLLHGVIIHYYYYCNYYNIIITIITMRHLGILASPDLCEGTEKAAWASLKRQVSKDKNPR